MRGDTGLGSLQAHRMIFCAEYGLHFTKDGDRWRCVEYPDLVMLPGPEPLSRSLTPIPAFASAIPNCACAARS